MAHTRSVSLRVLAVVAASLLAATACGGGEENSSATGDGASEAPIKLGWISDLTGAASIAGIGNRDGAVLAVEKVNDDGGVLGRPIELDIQDEACKPDAALSAVQRFLDKNVFMVLGGSCSGDVLAIKDLLTEMQVPFFVASASSAEIADPMSRYVFMNMVNTKDEAVFLTRNSVDKFEPKRIGIIYSANDYGKSGAQHITATANELGVDVGSAVEVPLGTTDFSPFILKLKEQDPDVVIPVVYEVPAFTKQAKQNGLDVPLVYFGSLPIRSAMEPLAQAGDLAGLSTSFTAPTPMSTDSSSDAMVEFVESFQERYGRFPDTADMNGYQSVLVVAKAIEKAGKLDRELLVETLETMGPIDLGLGFPLEYGPSDRAGLEMISLITFKDNQVPGKTGLYGTAELLVPDE